MPEWRNLADALRSGRSGQYARVGSNPTFGTGTIPAPVQVQGFSFHLREPGGRCKMEL